MDRNYSVEMMYHFISCSLHLVFNEHECNIRPTPVPEFSDVTMAAGVVQTGGLLLLVVRCIPQLKDFRAKIMVEIYLGSVEIKTYKLKYKFRASV